MPAQEEEMALLLTDMMFSLYTYICVCVVFYKIYILVVVIALQKKNHK